MNPGRSTRSALPLTHNHNPHTKQPSLLLSAPILPLTPLALIFSVVCSILLVWSTVGHILRCRVGVHASIKFHLKLTTEIHTTLRLVQLFLSVRRDTLMRRCHSSLLSLQYHLWLYGVLRVICADCRPRRSYSPGFGIQLTLDSENQLDGMIIRLVQTLDPTITQRTPKNLGSYYGQNPPN